MRLHLRWAIVPVLFVQATFFLSIGALAAKHAEEAAVQRATAIVYISLPLQSLTQIRI